MTQDIPYTPLGPSDPYYKFHHYSGDASDARGHEQAEVDHGATADEESEAVRDLVVVSPAGFFRVLQRLQADARRAGVADAQDEFQELHAHSES